MITDFTTTPEKEASIHKILDRMEEMEGRKVDRQDLSMALIACDKYDTPLDFDGMVAGRISDVGHDVYGIRRYINTETGKLGGAFHPRHALRPAAAKA